MVKVILFDCFGVMVSLSETRHEQMIDFVKILRPQYKVALISNIGSRASLDRRFKRGELDELFDLVIPSGDVGFEKPDPRIFQLALDTFDVTPEEAIFIDDSKDYVEAAGQLGIRGIHCQDETSCIKDIQSLIDTKEEKY